MNKEQTNHPLISVIIVSWNAKEFLAKCLSSIYLYSSDNNLEIIVIDNNSSDDSVDMIKKEFPDCTLILNKENLGFASASNIGIKASSGKYLCLVNSDVEFVEDPFPQLIRYMETHQNIGILGPKVIDKHGNIQRSWMRYPTLWNMLCRSFALDTIFPNFLLFNGFLRSNWNPRNPTQIDVINGCFWFIQKNALKKVGLLDEAFFMYGEDIDWCKRFTNHNWKIVYFPNTEIIHYGGGSSENAPVRFHIEQHKANLRYWKKYHGAFKTFLFRILIFLYQLIRILRSIFILIIPIKTNLNPLSDIKKRIATIRWLLFEKHTTSVKT